MFSLFRKTAQDTKKEVSKYDEAGVDPYTWGYAEAGGYDPKKLCKDAITKRTIFKSENEYTGLVQYELEVDSPYEDHSNIVLTVEEAQRVIDRWDMKKVGDWQTLTTAPPGELAEWSCGHDVMQDDDYWVS